MLFRYGIPAACLMTIFLGAQADQASACENVTELHIKGDRHHTQAINNGKCTKMRFNVRSHDTRMKVETRTKHSKVQVTGVLPGGTLDAFVLGNGVDAHLFAGVPCKNPVRRVLKGNNGPIVGVGKCQP